MEKEDGLWVRQGEALKVEEQRDGPRNEQKLSQEGDRKLSTHPQPSLLGKCPLQERTPSRGLPATCQCQPSCLMPCERNG